MDDGVDEDAARAEAGRVDRLGDRGEGGPGGDGLNCLFFSLSLLSRRTHTPGLAHSATLGAEDLFCFTARALSLVRVVCISLWDE